MEIITSLIEGGCYSAVFALLLFVALKTSAKREKCYRDVIIELTAGLKCLDIMNGKIDKLLEIGEKIEKDKKKKKKETVCDSTVRSISEAEPSSAV